MSLRAMLSIASGFVFIFAFYPYIKAIVGGHAKPRKATWFVWAMGDIIILAGMISQGTISGLIVGASIGATVTFLLSMKYGEPGWKISDKVCIGLSLAAIALWLYFGNSSWGIAFSLVSLYIAAWPTYLSAWENPANEDKKAWIWFNISSLLAVLGISHWTFADAAAPIVFMAIDLPVLYLLFVRPHARARMAA